MNYLLKYCFIISMLFVSCHSSRKLSCYVPQDVLRDTLTLDTTFLFEASGNFYAKEDILYTGPIGLIKPNFEITGKNYSHYKSSSINFIYGGGGVEYELLKAKYRNGDNGNSIESELRDTSKAKELVIANGFVLLERKIKLKCFLLGIKSNQSVINPSNNKPTQTDKIIYYGVYEIEE